MLPPTQLPGASLLSDGAERTRAWGRGIWYLFKEKDTEDRFGKDSIRDFAEKHILCDASEVLASPTYLV